MEWVVSCSLEGESWDGEEEGEREKERVGRVSIYWLLQMESYGHVPSIYPSISPPVTVPCHCTEISI
jgi:hypothetical protein